MNTGSSILAYNAAKKYIVDKINNLSYPSEHPFYEYETTVNGMVLEFVIILRMYFRSDEIIDKILKKCKSTINGKFNMEIYNQNISEIIILYYLIMGMLDNFDKNKLAECQYEPDNIFNNKKMLEYSFMFENNHSTADLINFEVKTLSCEPFARETNVKIIDGLQLAKPFFSDKQIIKNIIEKYPNAVVMEHSTHYRQLKKNTKDIIEKFQGDNLTKHNLINIGVIVINFSTSFEEFYSYMFHKEKGLFHLMNFGNLDGLVFFSLDNVNDIKLRNIYNCGYIQTVLFNNSDRVKHYLKIMKLDNYIAQGNNIDNFVLEVSNEEYGVYKVLARDGFLNIIPWDSSEKDINDYLGYLKSGKPR